MKKVPVFILLFCALVFIQSCDQKPSACFKTNVDEDSIHVNQLVTFNSSCSSKAGDFYWEFYDNEDSVFFSNNVQMMFYDTGIAKVYLLVTNGRQSSSKTQEIHVKP